MAIKIVTTNAQLEQIVEYNRIKNFVLIGQGVPRAALQTLSQAMEDIGKLNASGDTVLDDATFASLLQSIRSVAAGAGTMASQLNRDVEGAAANAVSGTPRLVASLRPTVQRYERLHALPPQGADMVNFNAAFEHVEKLQDIERSVSHTYLSQAEVFRSLEGVATQTLSLLDGNGSPLKRIADVLSVIENLRKMVEGIGDDLVASGSRVMADAGVLTTNVAGASKWDAIGRLVQAGTNAWVERSTTYGTARNAIDQDLVNYADIALELENQTPQDLTTSLDDRVAANFGLLPQVYSSVTPQSLGSGEQAGLRAQTTGISQVYHDTFYGRDRIAIPFRRIPGAAIELAVFDLDSASDFSTWVGSPEAILAIETGRAVAYRAPGSTQTGLLINVPHRGLMLVRPDGFYAAHANTARTAYLANSLAPQTFSYADKLYLFGASIETTDGLLATPENYILVAEPDIGQQKVYRLVDAATGQPLAGARAANTFVIGSSDNGGPVKYQTVAAYNVAIRRTQSNNLSGWADDGKLYQMRYLHRTVYGIELWETTAGERFHRSPDGASFVRETALNQPGEGWKTDVSFTSDAWTNAAAAAKTAAQNDGRVRWTAENGTIFSTEIFADSGRYSNVLAYVAETDQTVALHYVDGRWFKVETPSGRLLADQQFALNEETLAFSPEGEPPVTYEKIDLKQQTDWLTVVNAVVKASDEDQEVEWTHGAGPIFSSRRYLADYEVNTRRLVNLSGRTESELLAALKAKKSLNSKDVAPVELINGVWKEIDPATGQAVSGSTIGYNEVGEYFYRVGSAKDVERFAFGAKWDEVTRRVADGKFDAEWTDADGFVYSSAQQPADQKRRLVKVTEQGKTYVVAVEYAGQQLWNVINSDTGDIIPGAFARSADSGVFELLIDEDIAAAVADLRASNPLTPTELDAPAKGWEGSIRFTATEPWQNIDRAVAAQKTSGRYVEWVGPDGKVYTSRRSAGMTSGYLLTAVPGNDRIVALQKVVGSDWVVVDPATGKPDYRKVLSANAAGDFDSATNLEQEVSELTNFLAPKFPDGAQGGDVASSALLTKISNELAVFNASSSKTPRRFELEGESYVITNLDGANDSSPSMTGAQLLRRRAGQGGADYYEVLNTQTAAPIASDTELVLVVEQDGAFARPEYWNRDIDATSPTARVVTVGGRTVLARFAHLDASGDEVWVEVNSDDSSLKTSNGRLTMLRRSPDGGRFAEFQQGLPGGANRDNPAFEMEEIVIDGRPADRNISSDWEAVRTRLFSGEPLAFRHSSGERIFSADDNASNRDRLLTYIDKMGERQVVPASLIYGSVWQEFDPATGKATGNILRQSATSGEFVRRPMPLETFWQKGVAGTSIVAGPVDAAELEGLGVSPQRLALIRSEVPGMDFSAIASKPGHHDFLQGILQVKNDIGAGFLRARNDTPGFSTKAMAAVVTYGKAQGLSTDRSFIRGFGGRLISIDKFIHAYQNLDTKIEVKGDSSKTLRQHLYERYDSVDLPVQNLLRFMSEGAEYYERPSRSGDLPQILRVDGQATSLVDVHKNTPWWANYANNSFSVPGLEEQRPGLVHNNRRSVFVEYNKLENQIMLFHGQYSKLTGSSPQGEAAAFLSGPIISRLSGVMSVETLSNPHRPGKRELYDSVQRLLGATQNVQLQIPKDLPVVLRVTLQDGSVHLISIETGTVRMLNLSTVSNGYADIFQTAASGNPLTDIDTYSYDGVIAGPGFTSTGLPEPMLVLDTGDRVPVAPLVIPPPADGVIGQIGDGLGYFGKKAILDVLLGVGTDKIFGSNMLSTLTRLTLDVGRKVGIIALSSMGVRALDEAWAPDGPRIGAFGNISPADSNFWGGITGMVLAQNLLTLGFDKLHEYMPAVLSSRDSTLTHYVLPFLGNSAEELIRLYTNFVVQKSAGFPRGDWDSLSEWLIPIGQAVSNGALETFKSHGANVDGIDFQNGFITGVQFAIDSVARGSQNALATQGQDFSDIIGRAIVNRLIGRAADKLGLPAANAFAEYMMGDLFGAGEPMLDQYRRIYAKENPAGSLFSKAKLAVGNAQHWLANRVRSQANSLVGVPNQRIASRINRPFLLNLNPLRRLIDWVAATQPGTDEFSRTTDASLVLDKKLAGRTDVDYTAIFDAMKAGTGDAAGLAKPTMSWLRNTPQKFRDWITGQPWRADLFGVQAGPDFVQRLALAYAGGVQSGRLPQELGTFSSGFQGQIREISNAMLASATLEQDLKNAITTAGLSSKTFNGMQRAIYEYTVESGFFHYLLRYNDTGVAKTINVVDGIEYRYQTMSKSSNVTGDKNLMVSPLDVLMANFAAGYAQKYRGITYRGVNTQVGYAPDRLMNGDAGVGMGYYMKTGDILTNTEMFSTSQSGWMATSFGAGIDQLQLRTDTRQKLVILGETSFNATQLADLNQAEAIYTPGTIFEVDKIEGYADGNDIGNVVYLKQVDTFVWERNFYYLEKGQLDKITASAGQRLPLAMDPYTGIVYQLVKRTESGVVKYDRYYKPVNNYFLGRALDQRQGELARWFRPLDSMDSPQVMRDDTFALWLNDHEFMRHINEAVENVHHKYFREKYRNENATESAAMDAFRKELRDKAQLGATTAQTALSSASMDPSTGSLSTLQKQKLLVWQMANLLRRQVSLYNLESDANGRMTVVGQEKFSVSEAYDGVALSSQLDRLAQPKVTVGFRNEGDQLRVYVLLPSTSGSRSGMRWAEVVFNAGQFSSKDIENLAQAISIATNADGYTEAAGAFSGMSAQARARYEALISKMRALSTFEYDRYRHSLTKIYDALTKDATLNRVPTSPVMKVEPLPSQFQDKATVVPAGFSLTSFTVGKDLGSATFSSIVKDDFGRIWYKWNEAGQDHITPVSLYESFDYNQDMPEVLVFQNQDRSADKSRRFFVWSRDTGAVEARSHLPPHTASLQQVEGDVSQSLWIDSNRNIFLKSDANNHQYTAVLQLPGYSGFKEARPSTLAFEDLTDPTGKAVYVWRESGWPTSGAQAVRKWMYVESAGYRTAREFNENVAYKYFLDQADNTQWTSWSYRVDGTEASWSRSIIKPGNQPTRVGDKLIYTEVGPGDVSALRAESLSVRLTDTQQTQRTAQIHGMLVALDEGTAAVKLFITVNGFRRHIQQIGTKSVTIEGRSGAAADVLSINISTITNTQSSADPVPASQIPEGGPLIIEAADGQSLVEIRPGEFVLAKLMSEVPGSGRVLVVENGKLIDLKLSDWSWTAYAAPVQVNDRYNLTAYSVDGGDTIVYWDPKTSAWQRVETESLIVDGVSRIALEIGKQTLLATPSATDGSVSFSQKKGMKISALDAEGIPYDGTGAQSWLTSDAEYQSISKTSGFQRTAMSTVWSSFVHEFYQLLGLAAPTDALIAKTIEALAAKGINGVRDLAGPNQITNLIETLGSLDTNAASALNRVAVQLHLPTGVEFHQANPTDRPAAVVHLAIDASGTTIERWHWDSDRNAATLAGGFYSSPVKVAESPSPTPSVRRADASFATSNLAYSALTADGQPIQRNGGWEYTTNDHSATGLTLVDRVAANGNNAWHSADRQNLYLRHGDSIAMFSAQNRTQPGNLVRALDLGSRIAYVQPGTGWMFADVQTPTGRRFAQAGNYELDLTVQSFGDHTGISVNGRPIVDINEKGEFVDDSGRIYKHYDATLHGLLFTDGFHVGIATGAGNNCLIDSILQASSSGLARRLKLPELTRKASKVRNLMIAKMTEMKLADSSVTVIGQNEQIDVENQHQLNALVAVLRENPEFGGFGATDTLVVHTQSGLERTARPSGAAQPTRAIHLLYVADSDTGDSGHFAPILRQDLWATSFTNADANGRFNVVPPLNGALGENNAGASLPTQAWTAPTLADLTQTARAAQIDTSFGYERQLLLQLNGDEASYQAARDLFGKHPRQTEWVQVRGGEVDQVMGWRPASDAVTSAAPLQLDQKGPVRIVLVGHTTVDANGVRKFAGMNAQEITAILDKALGNGRSWQLSSIRIDLVGCELLQPMGDIDRTIPGIVADWLMRKGDALNIPRKNLNVSAREFAVRVTSAGKKEILTPTGQWVTKEDARLLDLAYKHDIIWDDTAQKLILKPQSSLELSELSQDLEKAKLAGNLSAAEQARLTQLDTMVTGLVRDRLQSSLDLFRMADADADAAEMLPIRLVHEADIAAKAGSHDGINVPAKAFDGISNQRDSLNGAALPASLLEVLASSPEARGKAFIGYQSEPDGKLKLVFADLNDEALAPVTVRVDDAVKAQALHQDLATLDKAFVDLGKGLNATEFNGPDLLNAGLLVQALMHLSNGFGDAPSYIKAQAYLGIAQGGLQLVGDVAETVALLRTLTAAAPGSKTLAMLGNVFRNGVQAIGMAAGVVSFGFDAKTLADALKSGDSTAVTAASVQLGFSGATLGLTAVSFVSGLLGAATVSAVAGGIAVPIAGLGIGITALVQAFLRNDKTAAAGFSFIHTINDAYSKPLALVGDNGEAVMVTAGAPVRKIDFRTNTVGFSNVTIGASKAAEDGHWWTSRVNDTDVLWVGNPVGAYDNQYTMGNSREDNLGLWGVTGHEGAATMELAQELRDPSKALVLTTMPELDADYTGYIRTNMNSDALVETIQKNSNAQVVLATNDHSAANWKYSSYATEFEVVLDGQNRTLVLPGRSDFEASMLQTPGSNGDHAQVARPYNQSLVSYRLVGGGGNYVLSLPADDTVRNTVTIDSGTASESWSFHLTNGLASGGKALRFEGPNKFRFNGQEISFSNHKGAAVALIDDKVPGGYVTLDLAKGTSMLVVSLGRWTNSTDPKALVEAVLKQMQPAQGAGSDILKSMEGADGRVLLTGLIDHENKSSYFTFGPDESSEYREKYSESNVLSGYYDTKTKTAILTNDRKDRIFSFDGVGWNQVWDVGELDQSNGFSGLDIYLTDVLTEGGPEWKMRNWKGMNTRPNPGVRKEIHLPEGMDFSRLTLTGTTADGDRVTIKLPPMYAPDHPYYKQNQIPAGGNTATMDVFKPGDPKKLTELQGKVLWDDSRGVRTYRHGQLVSVQLKPDETGAVSSAGERPTTLWSSFSDLDRFSERPRELPKLIGTDNAEILDANTSGFEHKSKRPVALYGQGGNDKLIGSESNDELYGGVGDDELFGNGGDDFFHGGAGSDVIDGGDGEDTVSFSGEFSAGGGVNIVLRGAAEATVEGVDAAADRIKNVENVIGSQFGDELRGDGNANVLAGRAGEDRLDGGGGNDTLIGGAGNDVYDLRRPAVVTIDAQDNGDSMDTLLMNEAIVADLAFSRVDDDLMVEGENTLAVLRDFFTDGRKQRYSLSVRNGVLNQEDFVKFVMAHHVDLRKKEEVVAEPPKPEPVLPYTIRHMQTNDFEMIGDEQNNVLYGHQGGGRMLGNGGHDILYGDDGDDNLSGGDGNDLLLGGADNDVLNGQAGDNVLLGGAGRDTYVFDMSQNGRITIADDGNDGNTLSFHSNTRDPQARLSSYVYGSDLIIRVDDDPNRQVTILNYSFGSNSPVRDIEFKVTEGGVPFTTKQTMSDFLRRTPALETDSRGAWNAWGMQAANEPGKMAIADPGLLQNLIQAMSAFNADASAGPVPVNSSTPTTTTVNLSQVNHPQVTI